MNVNEKGNMGLLKVITDLYSKGFYCFTPFDDFSPIDCIAMNNEGKTFRLQVKYRTPGRGDRYEISARSVVNGKSIPIDKTLLDFWAVYLADIDQIVYLSVDIMNDKGVHYITRKHISELDERLKSAPC